MDFLSTWQFNLIGYFIGIVVFFQFYKLAVKDAKKDGAATVLLQTIASIAVLFLSPFFSFSFPKDIRVYLLLFVACIFYALNDRLQTTARKHLQVSVYSVLGQLSNVFLILIGFLFFQESVSVMKILGAGLILIGNVSLFYKKGKFELNMYTIIAILANFVFAIAISIDIGIARQFNLPFYIMITLFVPAIMLFIGEKTKISDVIAEYRSENKNYYMITGVAWALTIFFSLRAFQFSEVTTIVPLQATSVFLNVVIAYFFLSEKKEGMRKIFAAILVITGVYFTVA